MPPKSRSHSKPTPSKGGAVVVRRVDVLSCVSKFAVTFTSMNPAGNTTIPLATPSKTQKMMISVCVDGGLDGVFQDKRIVRASGSWVHSDVLGKVLSFLTCPLQGRLVNTIPMPSTKCCAMAVNASETRMIVTVSSFAAREFANTVHMFSLPEGDVLKRIGDGSVVTGNGHGIVPVQFGGADGCCFCPNDNFIVADWDRDVLHEFTSSGDLVRSIPDVPSPHAVCVSPDGSLIAVASSSGFINNRIVLLDYTSGSLLHKCTNKRVFGDGGCANSLCFTPDGTGLIAPIVNECSELHSVVLLCVPKLSMTRQLCTILCRVGEPSLTIGGDGSIVFTDTTDRCVSVFDPDGEELLLRWGSQGIGDGEFLKPVALSYANGRLYVLDYSVTRVQVFE